MDDLKKEKMAIEQENYELVCVDGAHLKHVINQSKRICKAAIKTNPVAFKYVHTQFLTPDICQFAIKCDWRNIETFESKGIPLVLDLDHPDHKMYHKIGWRDGMVKNIHLQAIDQEFNAFLYIKHQSPETCLAAVKKDGRLLLHVEKKTVEICDAAVDNIGIAIQHVDSKLYSKEDYYALQLRAVNNDGRAISYIDDQTPELCLAAVRQNFRSLKQVKDIESIADDINSNHIELGLINTNIETQKAYQKLVKIREANEIARRINEVTSTSVIPVNKKVRL